MSEIFEDTVESLPDGNRQGNPKPDLQEGEGQRKVARAIETHEKASQIEQSQRDAKQTSATQTSRDPEDTLQRRST